LGRGTLSDVLAARFCGDDVAVKVVHSVSHLSPVQRAVFNEEVAKYSDLRHPHVVPLVASVVDVVTEPHVCALVTPRLETTLEQALHPTTSPAQPPLPLLARLRLALQVAHGVAHLHSKGFVHGDIKPSHVLLDAAGNAALTGHCETALRAMAGPEAALLRFQPSGSPLYTAPERFHARPRDGLTLGADVYSLSLLIHEILTGRRPNCPAPAALPCSPAELYVDIEEGGRPALAALPAELPMRGELAALLGLCCDADSRGRPAASALMACLEEACALGGLAGLSLSEGDPPAAASVAAVPAAAAASAGPAFGAASAASAVGGPTQGHGAAGSSAALALTGASAALAAVPAATPATMVLRHQVGQLCCCALPDGRLASGGEDGAITVWDAASGTQLAVLRHYEVEWCAIALPPVGASSIAWMADRGLLAVAHQDGSVRLWDVATRTLAGVIEGPELEYVGWLVAAWP
jgi:hypothetical protein